MKSHLLHPVPVLSWLLVSVLMGISGPFETSLGLSQPYLLFYWAVIVGGSILLAVLTISFFQVRFAFTNLPKQSAIEAAVFSAPNSFFVISANLIVFPQYADKTPPVWVVYLISFSIFMFVKLIHYYLTERTTPKITSPFLKRLKPEIGRDLVRICGQDHYIEVRTALGCDMILMRFSDALDELAEFDGLQVHRSHWVAKSAIKTVDTTGSKIKLHMTDGSEIPVSRSFRSAVKAAKLA